MAVTVMPRISVPVRVAPAPRVQTARVTTQAPETPHVSSSTSFATGMATGALINVALNSSHATAEEIKVEKGAPIAPGQTVDLNKSTTLADTDVPEVDGAPNPMEIISTVAILTVLICVVLWYVLPKRLRVRRSLIGISAFGIIFIAVFYWTLPK